MPGDVTVERPSTRIILIDLNNKVSTSAHHLRIATLWVRSIDDGCSVPCSGSLGQNPKIVAVEMHRMCCKAWILDVDADRSIGTEIVAIPVGRVGIVAHLGKEQDGLVVIDSE